MLEVLIPKVYEERYKTQCVTWAADSFLFGKNPDVDSFKPNPHGVDLKARLITERKEKQDNVMQRIGNNKEK